MGKKFRIEQQDLHEVIGQAYSEWITTRDQEKPEDVRANPDLLPTEASLYQPAMSADALAMRAVVKRSNKFLTAMQNKVFFEKISGKSFHGIALSMHLNYKTVYEHFQAAKKKFQIEFAKERENI